MAGIKGSRYIQLGKEATAGTSVAATAVFRATGVPEDKQQPEFIDEDIGYVSGWDRTHIPMLEAGFGMEGVATFQQLFYLFEASIKKITTGSADGSGSDKIYTYPFPTTTAQTIQTFTAEGGDNQQEEEAEYAFCSQWSLSGESGKAIAFSSDWAARQITASTKTGSLTPPNPVRSLLFQKSKLFIDTSGGTYGGTQLTSTWLAFKLSYKSGLVPIWTGDGNLYFTTHDLSKDDLEVTLDLTFLHNASATSAKSDWRSENTKLVQLLTQGAAFTTAGTAYSVETFIAQLAGKWEKFEKLDEIKGIDVVKGTFRSKYSPTAADFGRVILVNEVTAVP